jgi:hypothetical protein
LPVSSPIPRLLRPVVLPFQDSFAKFFFHFKTPLPVSPSISRLHCQFLLPFHCPVAQNTDHVACPTRTQFSVLNSGSQLSRKSKRLHHPTGRASAVCRCFQMIYLFLRSISYQIPPPMAQQPLPDQSLIIEASRLHTHSLGLIWTSDGPDPESSTRQHKTLTRDRYQLARRNSNPQSQQANGPQTHG